MPMPLLLLPQPNRFFWPSALALHPLHLKSKFRSLVRTRIMRAKPDSDGLGLLYDDGYGTRSVVDYVDIAKTMVRPDDGPPRWFCPVECGKPIKGSPLLLFLPGMDGVGMGLIIHHKSLGKVFEVRCLHIPAYDRTPFEGLLKLVEDTVKLEHSASPNKPIYLVGDSVGCCLALAVAARNPTIDLILLLSNPATSFEKSSMPLLLSILEAMPNEIYATVPYLLSCILSDPLKMGMAGIDKDLPPLEALDQLCRNLISMFPCLSHFADVIPKETLLWKTKLLKSAAMYANSRLHAVKAEVLVLAGGKDNMLPSRNEAERLWNSLENCKVRYFKDHGHALLLEDGINLLNVLKATQMYRKSRNYDCVLDFLPPSRNEFAQVFNEFRWLYYPISPVMYSTMEDGKIVRGLDGIPNEGPVLLVGYHALIAMELVPLVGKFLQEKKIFVRGLGHPWIFSDKNESSLQEMCPIDSAKAFGATPVSATNFYRLCSSKSFILLYPGGVREALHRKGEEYKLFWPNRPEFVRTAARFGATIVPFGVVGEDDLVELIYDYNDQMNTPFVRDYIKDMNEGFTRLRTDNFGELSNQDLYFPWVLPKIPGRLYYLFGQPIETRGKMAMLRDQKNANELYLQIKSEVENIISYLKRRREDDPYRSWFQRNIYQVTRGLNHPVPSFEP